MMSSVAPASTNPGLTDLIQMLSSSGSPLRTSGMSSSAVQSMLQNASPGDLVELSNQALRLQEVDGIFGGDAPPPGGLFSASPSSSATADLANVLQTLSSDSGSTASSSSTTPSLADQLTNYQKAVQSEEMQALFGAGPDSAASASLVDTLA